MPLATYACQDCGKMLQRIEGVMLANPGELRCECGSERLDKQIAAGVMAHGYTYGDPDEHAMAISNRNRIEREAEKFLSGECEFVQPKGIPKEYAPRVPEHLKKRYY